MPGTDLVLTTPTHTDPNQHAWLRSTDGERKQRAARAASTYDANDLTRLTLGYALTTGRANPHTQRAYRTAITRLVTSWQHAGINLLQPPTTAAHAHLRALEQELSAASVHVHHAGCRALYRALRATTITTATPFADTRVMKPHERAPHDRRRAYTQDELKSLHRHADTHDRVLLLLGAHAGLRLAEALNLTWANTHHQHAPATLDVRGGKGNRDRTVPLSPDLVRVLTRADAMPHGPYVLPYRSGNRARQRLRNLEARAGITHVPGRAMHSLRHTAGTTLYRHTADLITVQAWLGHADISTSRTYVDRVAHDDAMLAVQAFASLDAPA